MAAEAEERSVCSEIEVLQSIYLDEICVSQDSSRSHPWEISITLHPATADDTGSQYVCFTLVLSLTAQYPDAAPMISIRNPRGLSDDRIQSIYQALMELAEAGAGGQVLYQLIEKGKEILTNNNVPHCQCVICLDCFQENEAFTKTGCYHYFHSYCLARYIRHTETDLQAQRGVRQLPKLPEHELEAGVPCPVCREPLTYDLGLLLAAADPNRPLEPYQPDERSLKKRLELQVIFQRQQEKGGIIDPEAERNRFFISLTRPVIRQSSEEEHRERTENPSPAAATCDPERAPSPSDGPAPRGPPPRSERRGRPAGRGWAGPRRRPRPPADRREGTLLPQEDLTGNPRDSRLTCADRGPAAQDWSRPARGRQFGGAPERGSSDRQEAVHAQERRPWPRKTWPAPRQDWSKGGGHPRGRGSGRMRPGESPGSRDVSSVEPGPGETR